MVRSRDDLSDQEQPGNTLPKSQFLHVHVMLLSRAHSISLVHSEWFFYFSWIQVPSDFWRLTFCIILISMSMNDIQVLSPLDPHRLQELIYVAKHAFWHWRQNVWCLLREEAVLSRAYQGHQGDGGGPSESLFSPNTLLDMLMIIIFILRGHGWLWGPMTLILAVQLSPLPFILWN